MRLKLKNLWAPLVATMGLLIFFESYKKSVSNNLKVYTHLFYSNELGDDNQIVAIITPDKEIVENSNLYSPAYLIYDNYEIILKWNRSLRFALAVCTLKDKFTDEL